MSLLIEVFGYAFLVVFTLTFIYLSLIIVFRLWGKLRYFKEEVQHEYNKVKAKRLYEQNERKKILEEVEKEELKKEVNEKKTTKA